MTSISLRAKSLHKYLEFFRMASSLPLLFLYQYTTLFSCSNCSKFGYQKLSRLVPVFPSHHRGLGAFVFSTSSLSGALRRSRLPLRISCSSPRVSHFPPKPCLLFLEGGIRNQDLVVGTLVVTGVSLLLSLLFRRNKEIYVHVLTSAHTHISINISVYCQPTCLSTAVPILQ